MAKQLGQVAVGTIVKLNENGSPVEFIVGRQNYESGLNGNGRTLLIRIGSNYTMQWGPSSMSDPFYAASTVDTWLNTAYKAMLDAPIQEAIATTKFYYTPSGGASRSTLERAVFLGSATEFGFSNTPYITFNTEGSPLPEQIIDKIQYPPESWTRTPTAQFHVAISTQHGSAWVPILGAKAPDFITHVDPFFTLPSTFYVNDDGEISPIPLAPGSIDVPVQVMVGKPVSISWSAVDGAVSYTLERSTDGGGWSQIYSGANTSYTDTAGEWESAQYRVRAYANGVYSDYATSETVPVAPLSALVISGSDGDLGTLTDDVSYTVSSDGTNPLTVTEIINGTTARTFTATNGANNKISVMDLPTGSGTIKITASTNPGSGVVTVTRNWTYSKAAPTFANAGSTAQLQQNGKNIFPLTLLECVRGAESLAPGGFGLGAAAAPVTDLNQTVLSGWYSCAGSSNGPSSNFYGWLLVSSRTGAGGMIRQDAWSALEQPDHFVRYAVDGVWTPWEYVNPPMQLGVEYRTTERYNGNPVYAKAVNIGKLFSSYDSKEVDHGVSDMEACIECKGLVGQQNLIPNKDVTSVTVDSTTIVIEHNGFSGKPEAVVIIKYTKSTD